MKEQYNRLRQLVADMESDVNRYHDRNNRSAGVRVRKGMQEVKALAQEIRTHILDKRKGPMG